MKGSPYPAYVRLAIAGMILYGAGAGAQAPSAGRYAKITGVLIDSIHRGYLGGARVSVIGTSRSTTTDSAGRFAIDSIPPGDRELEAFHPLLDTLGIRLRVRSMKVNPGSTVSVAFGVPSPATYASTMCSKDLLADGDAVLVGTVFDADTEAPSEGAVVLLQWTDFLKGKNGVTATPQKRAAEVSADGTFIVCGIPSDLETGVLALRGVDSTAEVSTSFANGIAMRSFHLPRKVALPGDVANPRPASLTGIVVDAKGIPIADAQAAIEADSTATRTGKDGTFTLSHLRSGTRLLTVKRDRMPTVHVVVDLSAARVEHVTVKMSGQ